MKKLLKKKRHLGKFQEYCFRVKLTPKPGVLDQDKSFCISCKNDEEFENRIDLFMDTIILKLEANGLTMGGGLTDFIVDVPHLHHKQKEKLSEKHREIIKNILEDLKKSGSDFVMNYEVGPLRDAWYNWKDL